MQIYLRHRIGNNYRAKYVDVWPIDQPAAQKPPNWKGWPEQKEFALVLTHDVETAFGCSRCLPLMDLESSLGFRSCFNFVAADYPVPSQLRTALIQKGFEIGIHGLHHDPTMYSSSQAFRKQAIQINRYMKEWGAVGFRSPAMHHNLEWLHSLNLEYDASTFDTDPFEPQPDGMRTIYPFWVPRRDSMGGYVELPYTLPQDFTLFVVLGEKSIELWKNKLDWIVEHGGMALLITHPDYMNWTGAKLGREEYPSPYYRQFLEYVRDKYKGRYWHALPREVAAFWKRQYASCNEIPIGAPRGQHICMPTYSYYESDNRVRRYAESLVKAGNTVDVVSLRRIGQSHREVIENVSVHRIQQRTKNEKGRWSYFGKLLLFLIKSAGFISWKHIKKRYDIVHVHNVPDIEVFAAFLPKYLGSRIILDIHDIVPELFCSKFRVKPNSFWFNVLCLKERLSIAFANHVIVSNGIWQERLTERSTLRDKCSVFLNYPDPAIFSPRALPVNENRQKILYPGTLNWHQGLDIALRAFANIKDQVPRADFHIYGEGPSLETLLGLVDDLGIKERVVFHDPMPIREIAKVMATATCGIVPKRADLFGNEAFSTKILEFMALGVPVVVSNTAVDRLYFDPSLVLFFESGNVESLAEKLLLMLTNDDLRNRLVENSLKFVQDYTWAKKESSYFALLESLNNKATKSTN
jgi:glycosyltransferase involved in cell wall biosynthesis